MADNTFTHVCSLRLPSLSLFLPSLCRKQTYTHENTRAPKRLHAPLRYLKTETPAASADVLYVKPSGLFVRSRGMCVCVSGVEEGRRGRGGGGGGGWGRRWRGEVRTSSLPDSDAVRAATMAACAPLEGLSTPPAQIERWKEEKGG